MRVLSLPANGAVLQRGGAARRPRQTKSDRARPTSSTSSPRSPSCHRPFHTTRRTASSNPRSIWRPSRRPASAMKGRRSRGRRLLRRSRITSRRRLLSHPWLTSHWPLSAPPSLLPYGSRWRPPRRCQRPRRLDPSVSNVFQVQWISKAQRRTWSRSWRCPKISPG